MILHNFFRTLSTTKYNNKKFLIAIFILTFALGVDISITKIFSIIQEFNTSESGISWTIALFIIISSASVIGQYLVLGFVKERSKMIRPNKALPLNLIYRAVTLIQYTLISILVIVIFQTVITSHYNFALPAAIMSISYTLSIAMMVLLAQRFFSWFKIYKSSITLSYGISSAAIALNAAFTLAFVGYILFNSPAQVYPHLGSYYAAFAPNSAEGILNYMYVISSIVSFILTWISTALILRHYSERLGRIKYWILVSIPLAYFLSQFISLFLNLFTPLLGPNPIFFSIVLTLIFTLSKPAGGILFGIAFWSLTRNISRHVIVRDYLIISAYGFVLLFVSNQAVVLVAAPYPPFGLATISFMGLSSFLILVGIYSTAISVSEDSKLRQSIRKFAIKESKLLDSIGTAQMEQEIEKKVIAITKQHQDSMLEETGIQSTITEEDVKKYLEIVIKEVEKKRQE